jgi:serine/threonine protein kinase
MDDIKKLEPLFGSWYIDRVLGEGSFGKVYALKKTDFGKDYFSALKVISIPQSQSEISGMRSEGMDDKSIRENFEQVVSGVVSEFDLMARFRGNSHIVSYEDHLALPRDDGFGYDILIRMELLTSLVSLLGDKRFSKKDVIRLGIDICKALELCQKYNIIHRDIKPENIFKSDHGDFKLGDFGIARTVEKTVGDMSKKGTYTYMAPEVYKGEAYGSSVDIYSLGIVLYRLLNENRTPFLPSPPAPITHSDREKALMRRLSGERLPIPKGADGRLAEIVLKAAEHDPKNRYSNAIQMREELEAIQYNEAEGKIIYPSGDGLSLPTYQSGEREDLTGTVKMPKEEKTVADLDKTAYEPFVPPPPKTHAPAPQANAPTKKPLAKRPVFWACTLAGLIAFCIITVFVSDSFDGHASRVDAHMRDYEAASQTSGNRQANNTPADNMTNLLPGLDTYAETEAAVYDEWDAYIDVLIAFLASEYGLLVDRPLFMATYGDLLDNMGNMDKDAFDWFFFERTMELAAIMNGGEVNAYAHVSLDERIDIMLAFLRNDLGMDIDRPLFMATFGDLIAQMDDMDIEVFETLFMDRLINLVMEMEASASATAPTRQSNLTVVRFPPAQYIPCGDCNATGTGTCIGCNGSGQSPGEAYDVGLWAEFGLGGLANTFNNMPCGLCMGSGRYNCFACHDGQATSPAYREYVLQLKTLADQTGMRIFELESNQVSPYVAFNLCKFCDGLGWHPGLRVHDTHMPLCAQCFAEGTRLTFVDSFTQEELTRDYNIIYDASAYQAFGGTGGGSTTSGGSGGTCLSTGCTAPRPASGAAFCTSCSASRGAIDLGGESTGHCVRCGQSMYGTSATCRVCS